MFGPKKPCPNCGQHVKEPKDPSDFLCPHCHQPGAWASPDQVAAWHSQQAARASYGSLLDELAAGVDPSTVIPRMEAVIPAAAFTVNELLALRVTAVDKAAQVILSDHGPGFSRDGRFGPDFWLSRSSAASGLPMESKRALSRDSALERGTKI